MALFTWPWRQDIAAVHKALESALTQADLSTLMDAMLKSLVLLTVQMTVHFLYFTGLNGWLGATVGKLILGARIVRLDGGPLGFNQAALRYVCETVCYLSFFVGYILIGIREDKRGLHDLLARTKVVFKR